MRVKLINVEYGYLMEHYPYWEQIKGDLKVIDKKNTFFIVIELGNEMAHQIYEWAHKNV